MIDETKSKLTYWLVGLFMGAASAVPVTAYIVKKICDKDKSAALARQPLAVVKKIEELDGGVRVETSFITSDDAYAEPGSIPTGEEIENWNLDIDDKDATEASQQAVIDQERYKDMIQRYNGDMANIPHMIDAERFMDDQNYGKAYVNWYSDDNKFEEDLLEVDDPSSSFGVVNGADLFADTSHRDDPDIVFIRNEDLGTDFEITRIRGSFAQLVRGEKPIGQTTED